MRNELNPGVLVASHPADADAPSALMTTDPIEADPVMQAYDAYCRRKAQGEAVSADSFCAEFPHYQSSLGRLLQAHLFLEENFVDEPEVVWPRAGDRFLNFDLILELGQGAFARVYLAHESKVGERLVAVKISRHGGMEAEILGRNPHRNIVPVHSVLEDAATGLTAISMPYLGSATLCNVLDQVNVQKKAEARARIILDVAAKLKHPLDPSASPKQSDVVLTHGSYLDGIRQLGAKLADALAYLHERGIYHCDLKPSNVLLTPEGEPILLDFNLCADEREVLNRLGGTMPYMSPEQLQATRTKPGCDGAALDARSDIFSLGVILYQLATGEHPFGPLALDMKTAELATHLAGRHQSGATEARRVNPHIEPGFSALIQRCLSLNPLDRPASAAEIANLLRQDLAAKGRVKRWIGRHPGIVLTAATLLLALSAGIYAAVAFRAPIHQREIDQGTQMLKEQRFQEAIDHFSAALRDDPDNTTALFGRGRAFLQLKRYTLACPDFEEADKKAPHGRNKACVGYCLQMTQQQKPALEYYRQAAKADFATAEVMNNLGYCLLRAGKSKEAKQALDEAVKLDPRLQAAYHNRGLLAFQVAPPGLLEPNAGPGQENAYAAVVAGISDLREAIHIGPVSADLCFDCANLCAVAARVDRKWCTPTVEYLSSALTHGTDPKQLSGDIFVICRGDKNFDDLVAKAASPAPRRPVGAQDPSIPLQRRIVDPIKNTSR